MIPKISVHHGQCPSWLLHLTFTLGPSLMDQPLFGTIPVVVAEGERVHREATLAPEVSSGKVRAQMMSFKFTPVRILRQGRSVTTVPFGISSSIYVCLVRVLFFLVKDLRAQILYFEYISVNKKITWCIIQNQCEDFSRTEMMEFSSDYNLAVIEEHSWGKRMNINCHGPVLMWTSFHPLPDGIENNTYISFIGIYQCQRPGWLVLVKISHLVP